MHAIQLAYTLSCRRACVDRRLDCTDIAADHHGHKTAADLLLADQMDVCRLDHGVGCFNGPDQASGLYHSECFFHNWFLLKTTCMD